MVYKIDLHTHSIISPDGGISSKEYQNLLTTGKLDCIAVTDHNRIDFAQKLQAKLGDIIIIGEEITTTDGEMIGLFLTKTIPPGLTAKATAKTIHEQGGLVYIPHPFETLRQGIQYSVLDLIVDEIDIIESFNGRGKVRGKEKEASQFAKKYHLAEAASSDAHGYYGLGKTFSIINEMPTQKTLNNLLGKGKRNKQYAPLWTFLYPAINRMKKRVISSYV